MPKTQVIFFTEDNGSVPIVDWLDGLFSKAQIKCLAKLKRLEELGNELRRPRLIYCETEFMSYGWD